MKNFTLFLGVFYILIIAYFAVFNWNVFMLELDVNLGIGIIQFQLIAGIFLVGLFLFILLWINSSITNVIMKKKLANSNERLNKLRDSNNSEIEIKLEKLINSIDEVKDKINFVSKRISITYSCFSFLDYGMEQTGHLWFGE